MIVDLHTHSTCSDGKLTPQQLISRAQQNGVQLLAITDHDNIEAHGLSGIQSSLCLITGIEVSSQWQGMGIHVLGLNIDTENTELQALINSQAEIRQTRSQRICEKLAKKGIAIDYRTLIAQSKIKQLGRSHIAEYLVEMGECKDISQAFRKYLGKKEFIGSERHWPAFDAVIQAIHHASGVAVLAHPNHYKLTRSKLKRLIKDFKVAGGQAMEVISGRQTEEITEKLALLCLEYQLLASTGSDFHRPSCYNCDVGYNQPLPSYLTPVWNHFS